VNIPNTAHLINDGAMYILQLEKMEKAGLITSERDGYAVEEKDSYADVTIFSLLRDIHC